MAGETVTVRMSRSDASTAWGFRLEGGVDYQRPVSIAGVVGGSLAERAGLQQGDVVTQLCGRSTGGMSHQDVQNAVVASGNNVDLLVQRHGGVRSMHSQGGVSTWKPSYEATNSSHLTSSNVVTQKFQHSVHSPGAAGQQVSLEHRPPSSGVNINGHNRAAQPFGQQQYNTPAGLYSDKSKATEYLMQTGGLFGTDPAVQRAQQKQASGVNPATLEAIRQEDESRARSPGRQAYSDGREESLYQGNEQSASFKRLTTALHAEGNYPRARSRSPQPPPAGGAPQCDHCGRSILGVYCQAGGKNLHADCFKCSTCGSSLKHTGFFNIAGKLYCDVHAAQRQQNQYGARPPQDPSVFLPHVPLPDQSRNTAPIRASYQPDILKPGPVSQMSPGRPGGISPFQRGVPRMQQGYGADLTSALNSMNMSQAYSSSYSSHSQQVYSSGAPNSHSTNYSTPAPLQQSAPAISAPFAGAPTTAAPFTTAAPPPPPPSSGRTMGDAVAPLRGRGVLKQLADVPRIPICEDCRKEIRGPFVLAVGRTWCPEHFKCANGQCQRSLIDCGFVEESNKKYCETCFEQYFAPRCARCSRPVTGDCLNALSQQWHPECFCCTQCHQPFGNAAFFLEQGKPYCENDWNQLFTTKCAMCQFPIEAGDRWVEALNGAYHSDCFKCTMCQKKLEGQSFYAKGGRPYCKAHA